KPAETPPPPSGVKADELVAAAEFLSGMAAPTKRPSPVGKVALLRDAAGLLMQAQSADNAGLSTAQKLELPNKQRAAKEAADKAVADLMTAFDRTSQLPWVNLSSGNIKADWSSSMAYSHWKALDGGVLETSNGSWESMLRSSRANYADFVFECECYIEAPEAHPILYFREHFGAPYYHVEFTTRHAFVTFRKDLFNFSTDIADGSATLNVKEWTPLRVVFDGDHYMVWVRGEKTIDAHAEGNNTAGPVCLVGLDNTTRYRNVRMRELK
ncbi:MAG TPA: family 16 glycoside hydrolase, partial [Planctomycetota bacterium]|nr:family 16 glycoside hydrolase [Planctomycetota bacterium]